MEISVEQKPATCIKGIWFVVLVLLAVAQGVYADPKHPNDANSRPEGKSDSSAADANDTDEFWWKKWDAVVKNPDDPNELVAAKLNAVITVLQNKELEQGAKEKIIDKIISPFFDFELMSKLVLGKTHWPKLTASEQKKFTKLFTERLNNSYLEKITLYKDEKIQLATAMPQKMGIAISMDVLSDGESVAVLYKLRKADNRWKIYDVEIQGVSILLTYRSQFDDILRRGTVKDLFAHLEKSAAK
jgi:phospholipid transport system substrate-binding protein